MVVATQFKNSFAEGTAAEQEFISLRKDNIIRKASRTEDIHQHWDLLDKEFGKVDVKGPKRKARGDNNVNYKIHWWEFKNVRGRGGWGSPNGIDRYIAFRIEDSFILVNPDKVNPILETKCTEYYRGMWGLNTRRERNDLIAMIPTDFLLEHTEHRVYIDGPRA